MSVRRTSLDTADKVGAEGAVAIKSRLRLCVTGCLMGASAAALAYTASNVYSATTSAVASRDSCHLTHDWSTDASGRVLGFLTKSEAARSQFSSEQNMGGPMTPGFSVLTVAKVLVFKPEGSHI